MKIAGGAAQGAARELVAAAARGADDAFTALPLVDVGASPVAEVLTMGARDVEALLPEWLGAQRWFAGKGQALESVRLGDVIPVHAPGSGTGSAPAGHLAVLDVRYASNTPRELYAVGLSAPPVDEALAAGDSLLAPLARIHAAEGEFVLADAMTDAPFVRGLVEAMRSERNVVGAAGELIPEGGAALDDAARGLSLVDVSPLSLHTSNTSVKLTRDDGTVMGVLKLVRRHTADVPPGTPTRALDVWKGAYLTNETAFANTPRVFGSIDHVGADQLPRTVSVLQEFVPNDGDGWAHALDEVRAVLDEVRTVPGQTTIRATGMQSYEAAARNHGRRLGELHSALAGGGPDSEFRGVAETADQIAERIARLRGDAERAIAAIRRTDDVLPEGAVDNLAAAMGRSIDELEAAATSAPPIDRIHTHGDFHLGQVLKTGDDIQIIDLEGAPALPIGERWERTLALGDVARQRSSYEYAAAQGLRDLAESGATPAELQRATDAAERWADQAKRAFVAGWLEATAGRSFVPNDEAFEAAVREADLSNALYETTYELGSRPDWVSIPLGRLQQLVDARPASASAHVKHALRSNRPAPSVL